MTATIAIVAPGAMGAGLAARLTGQGATVLTSIEGRSPASRRRAEAAGMTPSDFARMAEADLVLSVVPPGQAVALARTFAPVLRDGARKPAYVDCNAISPATMARIAGALDGTGCAVVDGCLIGSPPQAGQPGPAFYVAGDATRATAILRDLGLDLRSMDAPLGAASALKMSYAGITKGLTALGAAMMMGAARAGRGGDLRAELALSQPQLLARFDKALPDMLPKAYRWVAEMREIAAFLGPDDPAALMFEGAAQLYDSIARAPEPLARVIDAAAPKADNAG